MKHSACVIRAEILRRACELHRAISIVLTDMASRSRFPRCLFNLTLVSAVATLSGCSFNPLTITERSAVVSQTTTTAYNQLAKIAPQLARLIDVFDKVDASNLRHLIGAKLEVNLKLLNEDDAVLIYALDGITLPTTRSDVAEYLETKRVAGSTRVINDQIMVSLNTSKLCVTPALYESAVGLPFTDTPTVPISFLTRTAYRAIGKHTASIILSSNGRCVVAVQVRIYQTEEK